MEHMRPEAGSWLNNRENVKFFLCSAVVIHEGVGKTSAWVPTKDD
jgi:hypothetical protein